MQTSSTMEETWPQEEIQARVEPVTQESMVNHTGVIRDICSSGKRPNLIITQYVFLISKVFAYIFGHGQPEPEGTSAQGSLVFQTTTVCRQMEILPKTKLLSLEHFSYMTESKSMDMVFCE